MFVDTQGPERIFGGENSGQGIVHAKIPESDLAVTTAGNKFSQATTLHMNVGDPLLVIAPDLDHRGGRLQSLIKDTNGTVAKTGNKDVTGHLV